MLCVGLMLCVVQVHYLTRIFKINKVPVGSPGGLPGQEVFERWQRAGPYIGFCEGAYSLSALQTPAHTEANNNILAMRTRRGVDPPGMLPSAHTISVHTVSAHAISVHAVSDS